MTGYKKKHEYTNPQTGRTSIVYLMDCMEGMAQFDDKHFDLAVIDPPYGIDAGKMTMGSGKHKFKKGKDWDAETPTEEYFFRLFMVGKNQIIFGGNYFTEILPPSNDWIIWDKLNPNLSFSEAEMAWCSIKRNTRIFKHYSAKVEEGGKIHPTQKPVSLYDWIYSKYLPEGGKVIDTHLGSGSNRISADKAGNIDFTAFEIDEQYFDDSVKRFENYSKQLKLF